MGFFSRRTTPAGVQDVSPAIKNAFPSDQKNMVPPRKSTLDSLAGFIKDIGSTGLKVYRSVEEINALGHKPDYIQPVTRPIIVEQPKSVFNPPGGIPKMSWFLPDRQKSSYTPKTFQEEVGYGVGQGLSPELARSVARTVAQKADIALAVIAGIGIVFLLQRRR